ncbi:F-box/FBD/LRR-repeat protein At5g56420-like [Nicotiana tabacum]|uniref:F-box/FBD/LRR-repeat protein At1g13570-like n=1 Tax=Nicotiana tabacum TaxID=4097 RepID=A0A1S3XJZ7_TOBAC|nr:PREDICTED: F-box/FBD/LRR-repeat protein At1g13570-like [Nicotiana tabacum]
MEGRSDVDAAADRISKLPEPILQHILYFLLAKDAARMSTLSKVWDSAWNSLSYLNFGDKFLKSEDMPRLVNVVNQSLANRQKHKISMQKFSLGLPHHRWLSYVDDWIKILIACNIKELNLRVSRPIYEGKLEYNSLPEAIFAAKALNVLRLDGFKIELPSDGIKFSSLRELRLSDVFLNEEFIQALCTSCCNLEDLYLQNFDGLASFQVGNTSLPKLKKVNLEFCPFVFQLVDIAAINLEDLKIDSLHGNLKVVKITACKALKTLYLNCVAVTDE